MENLDGEGLTIQYVPLEDAVLWDDNKKIHDIDALVESIVRYGFKDPPKYEPHLNNGNGGIVEGNGRVIALRVLRDESLAPPRGILVDNDGHWYAPILFGVDADSQRAAEAYGIDHNNLTLAGEAFNIGHIALLWEEGFKEQLEQLAADGQMPVSVSADDLNILMNFADGMPFPDDTEGDDDGGEEEANYDVIRLKVYRFEQVEDILPKLRSLIRENEWEVAIDIPFP